MDNNDPALGGSGGNSGNNNNNNNNNSSGGSGSTVIDLTIRRAIHPMTSEVLRKAFRAVGDLEHVDVQPAQTTPNGDTVVTATIVFRDEAATQRALSMLQGRAIYPNACYLELTERAQDSGDNGGDDSAALLPAPTYTPPAHATHQQSSAAGAFGYQPPAHHHHHHHHHPQAVPYMYVAHHHHHHQRHHHHHQFAPGAAVFAGMPTIVLAHGHFAHHAQIRPVVSAAAPAPAVAHYGAAGAAVAVHPAHYPPTYHPMASLAAGGSRVVPAFALPAGAAAAAASGHTIVPIMGAVAAGVPGLVPGAPGGAPVLLVSNVPVEVPLRKLYILLEVYGVVVGLRRQSRNPEVVVAKFESVTDATMAARLVDGAPFFGKELRLRHFAGYEDRGGFAPALGAPADADDPACQSYDFTVSRHRGRPHGHGGVTGKKFPPAENLFVANLTDEMSDADVANDIFARHGFEVVEMARKDVSYGIVALRDAETAVRALIALHSIVYKDRYIRITFSGFPAHQMTREERLARRANAVAVMRSRAGTGDAPFAAYQMQQPQYQVDDGE